MNDILNEIVAHKRTELILQKQAVSPKHLCTLVKNLPSRPSHRSMKQSLKTSSTGIIAEFKRRSPSKGWFNQDARADQIPPAYERAGAAVLSILTDEKYFGGSLGDIRTARPLVSLPILRKDFIIDPYQVYQARLVGTDAILLIAACLSTAQCRELACLAHELQLEVLLEVHRPEELDYIDESIDMVGMNNRNLGSFVTDVNNSFRMTPILKQAISPMGEQAPLLVSESGIDSADTMAKLREAGFQGFLIGEALMTHKNLLDKPLNILETQKNHVSSKLYHQSMRHDRSRKQPKN